jgi:uncharacterized membrane protein YkvA (DUF1232 family)
MDRLTISFELDADGLARYRQLLNEHRAAHAHPDEPVVVEKALVLLEELANSTSSAFVREQAGALREMIDMLRDADFRMDSALRGPVVSALDYFVEPDDLIPDDLPGLGHIDDAIMVLLVTQELEPELSAFGEFKSFRDAEVARRGAETEVDREDFLAEKRRQMFDRIRSRRRSRGR